MTNRFGRRLFELFFKSYNEKVWGVPASEIRAEWAAQRIKGLSFFSAARAAFFGNKGNKIKSLISEFNYPRFGPGPDVGRDDRRDRGAGRRGAARRRRSRGIELAGSRVVEVEAGDASYTLPEAVISSLPLREVVEMVEPGRAAAGDRRGARAALPRLPHRRARRRRRRSVPGQLDLHPRAGRARRPHPELPLVVAVDGPRPGQGVRRARVLLLRRRRPLDDGRRRSRRARRARSSSGCASRRSRRSSAASRSAFRRRTRSTTPTTRSACERSAAWLDGIENLQQVGRNGLHRYNNSDHSMLTAMRAVDNLLTGARPRHLGGQRRERLPRDRTSRTSIRIARRPRRPR